MKSNDPAAVSRQPAAERAKAPVAGAQPLSARQVRMATAAPARPRRRQRHLPVIQRPAGLAL